MVEVVMTTDVDLILDEAAELYLDHYRHPRHYQVLPQADAAGRVEWAGGSTLTFYLQLALDQTDILRIERATFQSHRCGIALAYASLLCELVQGRTAEEAWRIDPAQLIQHFGPRAGAFDAAGRAITSLRKALAQIPRADPGSREGS
jgi:NifU-like protein involved in Fe-S cluster formation